MVLDSRLIVLLLQVSDNKPTDAYFISAEATELTIALHKLGIDSVDDGGAGPSSQRSEPKESPTSREIKVALPPSQVEELVGPVLDWINRDPGRSITIQAGDPELAFQVTASWEPERLAEAIRRLREQAERVSGNKRSRFLHETKMHASWWWTRRSGFQKLGIVVLGLLGFLSGIVLLVGPYRQPPERAASAISAMSSLFELQQGGTRWNVWEALADTQFAPVKYLSPDTDYLITLDLSNLEYTSPFSNIFSRPTDPEFRKNLAEWLSNKERSSARLKVLLVTDEAHFDSLSPRERVGDLKINLDRIREQENSDSHEVAAFEVFKADPDPKFVFGRVSFPIHTKPYGGMTAVAFSLWINGIRPIDEFSVPICISAEPDGRDCAEKAGLLPLSLSGDGAIQLAASDPEREYPDGALHFLELSPSNVVGVFHRKDWPADRFETWHLGISSEELQRSLEGVLIPALKEAVKRNNEEGIQAAGYGLFNLLFPPDEGGKKARFYFEQFVRKYRRSTGADIPRLIFVRMIVGRSDVLNLIPLGFMAVPIESDRREYIGFDFRVATPLPQQNYEASDKCISDWVMVLPPEGVDKGELKIARDRLRERIPQWETSAEHLYSDFTSFGNWIGDGEQEEPTAVVVLSHHDKDRLYFSPDQGLLPMNIVRRFPKASVAILDGCGTGGPGAVELIAALNRHGVMSIVATTTEISPPLAADFLDTLNKNLQESRNHNSRLSMVFFKTIDELRNREITPDELPYGSSVLNLSLLGNGNVALCKPNKRVHQ